MKAPVRPLACFGLALGLFLAAMGCGGGSTPQSPAPPVPPQITWLQQTARPLASVEPTANDSDLAFLDGVTGDAPLVGFGEATHGSAEFQKMKHRMFRYLVEHKGFTVFGLEAQMGLCKAIDDYIQTGQGDPAAAVKGQRFWVWSTQEMLDQVQWMRAYNANPANTQKLRFVGFDMQDGGGEMDRVVAYVRPIDAAAADGLAQLYEPFRPYTFAGTEYYATASQTIKDTCRANIQQAYQWMVDHQAAYTTATSAQAYAWALQLARVVVQSENFNAAITDLDAINIRDRAMAENIDWFMQYYGTGTKAALSAHNAHVNKTDTYSNWASMGELLAQRRGNAYRCIGFAFQSGSFQANLRKPDGTYSGVQVCTASSTVHGSYENAFAEAGLTLAALDMRVLDNIQPGPAWFNQSHPFREIGAVWHTTANFGVVQTVLPQRFDAVIFIKMVNATHLLP